MWKLLPAPDSGTLHTAEDSFNANHDWLFRFTRSPPRITPGRFQVSGSGSGSGAMPDHPGLAGRGHQPSSELEPSRKPSSFKVLHNGFAGFGWIRKSCATLLITPDLARVWPRVWPGEKWKSSPLNPPVHAGTFLAVSVPPSWGRLTVYCHPSHPRRPGNLGEGPHCLTFSHWAVLLIPRQNWSASLLPTSCASSVARPLNITEAKSAD